MVIAFLNYKEADTRIRGFNIRSLLQPEKICKIKETNSS